MPGATTISVDSEPFSRQPRGGAEITALVIAWSADEPGRVAECAFLPDDGRIYVLGRGDEESNLRFFQQRPGTLTPCPPLAGAGLSRKQLTLTPRDGRITIERVGKCELRVNGATCDKAEVTPGDTIHMKRQLVLTCVRREPLIPPSRHFPRDAWRAFGEPDAFGILGESPAIWRLREQVAFAAMASTHVLVTGPSGSGKELAARAIHALSKRASRPFVARNAATLPAGLIDAELFGNAKNYPNAGMPERPGLIGEADGGTLFLDEVAEIPAEQQAHLLRVLDAGGEYQRLGDAGTRSSDLRLVGATNRDPSVLKHDFRARLTATILLAPLSARREDVPLLVRHLLLAAAKRSPEVAARFVGRDAAGRAYPRLAPAFIEHVIACELETNTRELEALLWQAMERSPKDVIVAPVNGTRESSRSQEAREPLARSSAPEPSKDEIASALQAAAGSVEKAARALGLSSRYALYRLMKKHGLSASE